MKKAVGQLLKLKTGNCRQVVAKKERYGLVKNRWMLGKTDDRKLSASSWPKKSDILSQKAIASCNLAL